MRWLALSVVAGLAIGALLFGAPHSSFSGPLVAIVFVVLLGVLLAGVPWLALRPGWSWWLASAAGLIVGFVFSAVVLVGLLKVITICVLPPCTAVNPYAAALVFVVPLAVMGLAQTFTLNGPEQRIGWLVTALIAAVVLPYGLNVAASLLREDANNPALPAFLIAGAAWGIVVGVGLSALTSMRRV